jgi:hypothetical protein
MAFLEIGVRHGRSDVILSNFALALFGELGGKQGTDQISCLAGGAGGDMRRACRDALRPMKCQQYNAYQQCQNARAEPGDAARAICCLLSLDMRREELSLPACTAWEYHGHCPRISALVISWGSSVPGSGGNHRDDAEISRAAPFSCTASCNGRSLMNR